MKDIVNDGFAKVVKPYMDAQNKKDRELIAPVEVSPAESAHSIGDQIIFNGILYNVTAQIAVDDPLSTTGAGANISLADNIETQLKNQQTQIQSVAAQAAAQSKIAQEMLAPIEEDETDASRAYEIGDQLILDGVLYDVIDDIAQHGIITPEGSGANIEAADTITDQIKSKIGSVNQALENKENAPIILSSTLTAGATTLAFTNPNIGNDSRIRVITDPFIKGLEDAVQSGTTVTLTFTAQAVNVAVKLEIYN